MAGLRENTNEAPPFFIVGYVSIVFVALCTVFLDAKECVPRRLAMCSESPRIVFLAPLQCIVVCSSNEGPVSKGKLSEKMMCVG